MGRNQVAHRQLRFLLELQRRNGVTYNLGYTSAYTPVVMKFLAKAARGYLARLWHGATARTVMTDVVKVGSFQWLDAAARLFVFKRFVHIPIGAWRFEGEARDAPAVLEALASAFKLNGIREWLDAVLCSLCVDGASVLRGSPMTTTLRHRTMHYSVE